MVDTETITRERLAIWEKRLAREHATPMVLIGVGHDQRHGQPVLITTEDMPLADLHMLLAGLAVWVSRDIGAGRR